MSVCRNRNEKLSRVVGAVGLLVCLVPLWGWAQEAFDCGSDGSDGALTFEADAGVVVFDPALFDPPLDQDGDGIYHFTTITIPSGTTVKCRADKCGWQPLYWLCQGDVVIDGVLDLDGEPGADGPVTSGLLKMPGPGGFPGARGQNSALDLNGDVYGFGPGTNRHGGEHPGNHFLQPLTGGSGGGGETGCYGTNRTRAGSGAGGGAILLASNTSIAISGSISCQGGGGGEAEEDDDYHANGGASGAFRLLGPVLSGGGTISAKGGAATSWGNAGQDGWVRIETNDWQFDGTINCSRFRRVTLAPSVPIGLPTTQQQYVVRVARINGIDVPESPTGTFDIPDVLLNTSEPVVFEVEAQNVPLGTTFTIFLWNETDQAISLTTTGLEGTLEASTATATHAVPTGFTQGFVYGTFTPTE